MAKKKGGTPVNEPEVTLADIVAATQAGTIIYTFVEVHEPLVAAGMVEINPAMVDGEAIATRATQAGIDAVNAVPVAPVELPLPKLEKTKFNIVNIPVPEKTSKGGREVIYPFDMLEVGQSFFVPNTESRPNIAKSLTSTVSSAHARFSVPDPSGKTREVKKGEKKGEIVPVMVKTRTFSVSDVADGAAWGFAGISGAVVGRTK